MLYSMTGFGRATATWQDKILAVEIRSLNSKQGEMRLRLPAAYREKEGDIRRQITEAADRGKIDFALTIEAPDGASTNLVNETLFLAYAAQLKPLIDRAGLDGSGMLSAILRLPNVVGSEEANLEEGEWETFNQAFKEALLQFVHFRAIEGQSIETELRNRIAIILDLLDQVLPFEQGRMEKQRSKLHALLADQVGNDRIDNNRFEQELIFYLEKMDITEEKVRLRQHCQFFLETLDQEAMAKGRTLNFISQELGREINTMGAKANDSGLQRCVVQMKDELEKVKEQLANIV